MSVADRVTVVREGGVAQVRLARPEKRNGLDPAMFEALVAAGDALRADPAVRAVVLAGEGPSFCAGLDWGAFLAAGPALAERLFAVGAGPANLAQRAAWTWRDLPVPVIAALHGACLGGGLQIALGCDLRIAAPGTILSVREVQYGLVPDMSATRTLARLVRPDLVRELVYTGRDVDAGEAVRIGLVTSLADDPIAAATTLARRIAERSPDAVRAAKRLFADAEDLDAAASLAREAEVQRTLLGSPNQLEAVAAVFQKRPPAFRDPG